MTQIIEKITLELVRDNWEACYPSERLEKLFDRPLTVEEVLTRQDGEWASVPIEDRFWVVLRDGVLPDRTLRLFAAACAEKACQDANWTDPRSLAAIQAARDFADGKITAEELDAAWAAADAAWSEAWAAADGKITAEELGAAADAAWSEAWSAAARAEAARAEAAEADAAARAEAARAEARDWQLKTLLQLISEEAR